MTAESDSDLHALADEVRSHTRAIAARVTDETLRDPFWTKRYADRGRARTEEDAAFHVEYLLQALVARDAEIMRRYARWLQTLLTSRGMCTAHLDENFARVGAAILEAVPRAHALDGYVKAARAALLYSAGAPREVQSTIERANASVREHLDYLADALALEKPEVFASHISFARAASSLDTLARAIADDSRLSPDTKAVAAKYIEHARATA